MASSRSRFRKRAPGPGKRWAEWALVRGWVALLSLVADWIDAAPAGPARDHWRRHITRGLGKLEQILRCLLLLMRPPRSAPKTAPFIIVCSGSRPTLGTRRARPRFSVTLRKFSWYTPLPKPAALLASRSPATPRSAPEDRTGALQRRLAAMRGVFADPASYAARIAAACLARGLRPRRPKAAPPSRSLWTLPLQSAPARAPVSARQHLDTS